jgi:hypothetical protein
MGNVFRVMVYIILGFGDIVVRYEKEMTGFDARILDKCFNLVKLKI